MNGLPDGPNQVPVRSNLRARPGGGRSCEVMVGPLLLKVGEIRDGIGHVCPQNTPRDTRLRVLGHVAFPSHY